MNRIQNFCCLVLMLACSLGLASLKAQGPSVLLDTCLVANTQHFKSIPIPGEFVPGSYEDLRACPSLGNNVVKINHAIAGKAKNLLMTLRIEAGKLTRVVVITRGVKNFEKLYSQVIAQAGVPSKMVDQKGVLSYSWDLRYKLKATVVFIYDPVAEKAVVTVTP